MDSSILSPCYTVLYTLSYYVVNLPASKMSIHEGTTVFGTVVRAMLRPSDQRTPAMSGHFRNASIVFNANVPVIRGHMPNMDRGQYTARFCRGLLKRTLPM